MCYEPNFTEVPEPARCAIYARYRSLEPRCTSSGDQERLCRELAAEKGWQVLEEHIYRDIVISGIRRPDSKGLEALEAAVRKLPRPFEYVLFEDTSRLSRNLIDVREITESLHLHGVEVYFANQQLDSSDVDFRLTLSIPGILQEQYAWRLRDKVKIGLQARVLRGYTAGGRCFG